jgi:hypothetical protein
MTRWFLVWTLPALSLLCLATEIAYGGLWQILVCAALFVGTLALALATFGARR